MHTMLGWIVLVTFHVLPAWSYPQAPQQPSEQHQADETGWPVSKHDLVVGGVSAAVGAGSVHAVMRLKNNGLRSQLKSIQDEAVE